MLATVETTFLQHGWNVTMFFQKRPRLFQVPSKEGRCHNRSGHDFRITHLTLDIFMMMKSFQNIVTNAINGYNLTVQEGSSALVFGVVTSTLADPSWTFKSR